MKPRDDNIVPLNKINEFFIPYNFKVRDIIEFENYILGKVKGQNKAIEQICRVLLNNIIRTEEKPLFFFLVGKSGCGKDYIVKNFSEFFKSISLDKRSFGYTEIDVSQHYYAEFKIFTGNNFENKPSLFEKIAEEILSTPNGNYILNFTEIDKGRIIFGENTNKLQSFFEPLMQFLENRFQTLKGSKSIGATVDVINLIIFFSGNFLFDLEQDKYQKKIGFSDEKEELKNKREFKKRQKFTKQDLLDYLKKNLGISIYNRLTADKNGIILMDDIKKPQLKEIFYLEYSYLIDKIKESYRNFNKIKTLEKYFDIDNTNLIDTFFNKYIKDSDSDEGARGIRNYINTEVKSYIIDLIFDYEIEKDLEAEEKAEARKNIENQNKHKNNIDRSVKIFELHRN